MNSLTQQTKWTRNHSNVFGMCHSSFLELLEAEILKCQHLDIFHHASCKNESLWENFPSRCGPCRETFDDVMWLPGIHLIGETEVNCRLSLSWIGENSEVTAPQVKMYTWKKKNTKKIVRAISPIFFPGLQLPCVHELYFTSPYCNHWHTHDTIKRSAGIFSCSFEYLMDAKGAQLVQMVRQSLDGWAKPSKHSREPR